MSHRISTVFALTALLLLAGTAWAHHNMSAIFDFNDRVTLNGTLAKYDWRNPHIEFIVEVKDKDKVETWKVEGPAPGFFRDRDFAKADFESAIGKSIKAEASRARDGSKWGLLRTMTLPGGKLVSACPQNC